MIRHHFADSCTSLNTIPPGSESQRCKGRWQTHAGSLRKAISHNLHIIMLKFGCYYCDLIYILRGL